MDTQNIADEILATIRAMNRCWTEGWHEEQFRQYIHPEAVAIVPSEPGRLAGREAYVAGWRGFTTAARIQEWQERDHRVQIYNGGKSAVVTYLFSISFTVGTQQAVMQGRDMFFLVKEGREWQIVADQFSPQPLQNTPAQSADT